MSTTIAQLKTIINNEFPDSTNYVDASYIAWVNELELDIATRIMKKFTTKTISAVAAQEAYSYPAGYGIDDIYSVFYNDNEYQKVDVRTDTEASESLYYKFWDKDGTLAIYPTPLDTSTITLACLITPTVHSATSENLRLPSQFIAAYKYYIYSQIALLKDDDKRSQKWLDQYNVIEQKIEQWYPNPMPPIQTVEDVY